MSYADGHCDTIVKIFESQQKLYKNNGHIDIERIITNGSIVQLFAIYLNPRHYQNALPYVLSVIDFYYEQLIENKEYIEPAFTYGDIINNRKNNKATAILGIEGAEPIGVQLSLLRSLYRQGLRLLGLTWNYSNALATGVSDAKTGSGLTSLGFEAVELMNDLGIIIDVSHLSEKSFWDVHSKAKKPFVASHSNATSIRDVPRNLTDRQIKAVAEKGGTIGINFYSSFLSNEPQATLDDILHHVEHIIKTGGSDVISLGGDLDGIDSAPLELADVSGMKILLDLVEAKFGAVVREKMADQNFLRVVKDVWK